MPVEEDEKEGSESQDEDTTDPTGVYTVDKDVSVLVGTLINLSADRAVALPTSILDLSISDINVDALLNPLTTGNVSINLMTFSSLTLTSSPQKQLPRSPVFNWTSSSLFQSTRETEKEPNDPQEEILEFPSRTGQIVQQLDDLINFETDDQSHEQCFV
ncbi:unnamed protein product [Didymodactylos carnosus]|uniref:Uncharacterized protein n=1 Tax=Didymodactylos carnosus TaxID=1234261 RepID=A0A815PJQ6_9BILA|nr:unnamed protein product [Didymodactylos carnosus]CAF4323370.1 unnamed protein product [Didymodactylos carnosus]